LRRSWTSVAGSFPWFIYNLTRKPENLPITYQNTVLIYNPQAGRFGRGGGPLVERAVEILTKQGCRVWVVPTTGPGVAGALARDHASRGVDLIVAAGGDGTVNEIVEGMVHTEVPLAILPGGTANVLAMELTLGRNLERVAERLHELRPHRISVGHVTCDGGRVSRHFLLMAGIGLDAHIVYHVNGGLKALAGKLAYWVAGGSLLGRRLPSFEVEIGGQTHSCSFALLSKVRNYGGDFEIARSVSLFDDDFEAVLFEGRTSLGYVKYVLGMALNRLNGMKGLTVLRADRMTVSCSEDSRVYVQIDGESAGRLPAEIRIVPNALTLLVPPEYERRLAGRR
jgi:diacylglycerol kinase (ATP)